MNKLKVNMREREMIIKNQREFKNATHCEADWWCDTKRAACDDEREKMCIVQTFNFYFIGLIGHTIAIQLWPGPFFYWK